MSTVRNDTPDQIQITTSGARDTHLMDDLGPGILSELERRQLEVDGFLTVTSSIRPERVYRVMAGPKPTEVLEYGRVALSLWLESAKELPVEQGLTLEKLLIERYEPRYLRLARPAQSANAPRNDFLDNGLRSFNEQP